MSTQPQPGRGGRPHRYAAADLGAPPPAASPADLGARQRQVLALVADGLTSRQIAALLGIAPATVRNHLHAIYPRLPLKAGGSLRVQAALWYLRYKGAR